jgi:putative copper export protein
MSKKLGNKYVAWFKFLQGVLGVSATVVWFVFMVGSPVVVTLAGVPVLGSFMFSMILIGNAYGLWTFAKEGHATLQEHRDIADMHKAYREYHGDK